MRAKLDDDLRASDHLGTFFVQSAYDSYPFVFHDGARLAPIVVDLAVRPSI
jgi:hypothetical protein